MKISDLRDEDIKVGLRIRSMIDPTVTGEVIEVVYPPEDRYQWAVVRWTTGVINGFWENQCDCEIVE